MLSQIKYQKQLPTFKVCDMMFLSVTIFNLCEDDGGNPNDAVSGDQNHLI